MATRPLRVVLVDDHVLFRQGMTSLLELDGTMEVVGEATDGLEAIQVARRLEPHLVLMDLALPRCDGLTALQEIKRELPNTRVVVLTASDRDQDLLAAIQAGADGYLLKTIRFDDLISDIKRVASGDRAITAAVGTKLLIQLATERRPEPVRSPTQLTDRELEVLKLVAQGATNREIGEALVVSQNTVRAHLRNILDKLNLDNRIQAAAFAVKMGLVTTNTDARRLPRQSAGGPD